MRLVPRRTTALVHSQVTRRGRHSTMEPFVRELGHARTSTPLRSSYIALLDCVRDDCTLGASQGSGVRGQGYSRDEMSLTPHTRAQPPSSPASLGAASPSSHSIRFDSIRFDSIRFDSIRFDSIRFDSIRFDSSPVHSKPSTLPVLSPRCSPLRSGTARRERSGLWRARRSRRAPLW